MDGNGRGGIQDGWIVISTVQVEVFTKIFNGCKDFSNYSAPPQHKIVNGTR